MRERRLPAYVVPALAGTMVVFGLLLLNILAGGEGAVRAIRFGARGPSVAVVIQDSPEVVLADDLGLDGQQFYAMARDPLHPEQVAASLDNARYRYQRPLYPLLAWLLHPSGGGPGLVWALIAVGLAGVLVGALALGALTESLRGPPRLALLYPRCPVSSGRWQRVWPTGWRCPCRWSRSSPPCAGVRPWPGAQQSPQS